MPTSVDIKNLKINKLTEAQYDTAVQGGVIGENELSVITDMVDKAVQVSTMPTAGADELGNIYQYVGATDANYTNGYFYKCEGAGDPVVYSWAQVNVQPGSSLPSQSGNDGKFLTTNGTDASWSDAPFVQKDPNKRGVCISSYVQSFTTQLNSLNIAIIGNASYSSMSLGKDSIAIAGFVADTNTPTNIWGVLIGSYGRATGKGSVALGSGAQATADGAIQISSKCQSTAGYNAATNSDANTFKVANGNGNYEMMSADGTIPTDRLTKVNTTITLAAADWSSNSQTVNVTGMTATGIVMVSPDPTDQADYTAAGIICSAQAAGTLTFTCDSTPANDIDVVVVML